MEYKVQILSDNDFESLPYPETDISFGIADPVTKTAYVRYNPDKDVMNYLVNHEIEHLIEGHGGEHADHYRNGVYYKGLFDIFTGGGQQSSGGLSSIVGQALASKQPSVSQAPAVSQSPNVVRTGGGEGGDVIGGTGISPDVISRLKGFFSGRNPSQGGF